MPHAVILIGYVHVWLPDDCDSNTCDGTSTSPRAACLPAPCSSRNLISFMLFSRTRATFRAGDGPGCGSIHPLPRAATSFLPVIPRQRTKVARLHESACPARGEPGNSGPPCLSTSRVWKKPGLFVISCQPNGSVRYPIEDHIRPNFICALGFHTLHIAIHFF